MKKIPSLPPPAILAEWSVREAALVAACAEFFPTPVSLVLELGCGHGHFLTAYAQAHPHTRCFGVDRATKRIARSVRKQSRHNLGNVAFIKADAAETLAALPMHVRLQGIFILFPDPWPKKRHHVRRLLQPELLDALAARAEPGVWLAHRTDHADFFAWAKTNLAAHPQWRLAPELPWPFEHSTVFQELHDTHHSLMAVRR